MLAKGSLLWPHQVEVAAVLEEGASPHSVLTVKLWLAVLDSQLESAFEECTASEPPLYDFLAASSSVPVQPDVDGLIAAADNLFQFVSAAEGPPGIGAPTPAQPWEQRVSSLESSLASIQASLAKLASSSAAGGPPQPLAALPPPGLGSATALPSKRGGIDPGIVAAARAAEFSEATIVRMGALASSTRMGDAPAVPSQQPAGAKAANPLSESEEEVEGEGIDPSAPAVEGQWFSLRVWSRASLATRAARGI